MRLKLSLIFLLSSLFLQAQITSHQYGAIIESPGGGWPVIYMGQDAFAPHRYLQLINSTNSTNAGGIKVGGLMVADNYGFANPSENDVAVKGNVSIGLSGTNSKLHVYNSNGGHIPSNYMTIEGNSNNNLNYPSLLFKGGTFVSNGLYPYIGLSNGGLSLALVGGQHDIYNQRISMSLNSNEAGVSNVSFYRDTETIMYLDGNSGNLGLGTGTSVPDSKLTVKGDIHAEEVKVDLNGALAPDYVFEEDYDLKSLEATEKFIKMNKHLPEIPSAVEMEEEGIELKVMNLKLLQKIEELTLYMIDQNKRLELLEEENKKQAIQIGVLSKG